uniref:Uncharacterized protein n=1 Tax=Aureoumbra lagunensis TaxID=44058 RepID=A0A7S3NHC5_9STRA|mmetsp:Transcript_1026/g.1279  ORF Transcript_1026/g.1279 Transcript_1026/m.1279 type:complete len:279 (+) Transcript_1026:61-897(+)
MTLLSPRVVGDVTLVFVLLSIAFYGFLVVGHFLEYWQLDAFGKNWALDGFCLSFKESFFHTHLLCFYGDAILGAFVYMLCPRNRPEINVIRSSIPSVVAHGGAHGLLWALPLGWQASTKKNVWIRAFEDPISLQATLLLGIFIFWYFFLCKIKTPFSFRFNIFQSIIHTLLLQYFVPTLLAFTYVNTVIFFNLLGHSLLFGIEGQKDVFYAIHALTTSFPIMIVTWLEPLLCDSFLIHYGGHIIFDYSIPISYLLYIAVASNFFEPRASSSSIKEKIK